MPDRASRSDDRTSCESLPIAETIPMPVTTTRLIAFSCSALDGRCTGGPALPLAEGILSKVGLRLWLEKPDAQILRLVNALAVGLEPAIGDAEHELAAEHTFQIDTVNDL